MANLFRSFLLAFAMICAISQVLGVARRTSSNRSARGSTGHMARDVTVDNVYFPYLIADEYAMIENDPVECINVLSNDLDHNLDASTLALYAYPENGVATVSDNKICYRPRPNFNGWELFSYSVCNTLNICEWAEIRVYVAPVNQAPTAVHDFASVREDELSVTIDVLANDYDVDGPFSAYSTLQIVAAPHHGTVFITSDHKLVYTPSFEGYNRQIGIDYITYQICDNEVPGLCSFGSVGITVEDSCFVCEACRSKISGFNDHASTLQSAYHTDVFAPAVSP